MIDAFKIETPRGTLALSEPEPRLGRTRGDYVHVALTATGIQAECDVYYFHPHAPGLGHYFSDLAQSWKGWNGTKSWASLEREFSIDASHDGVGTVGLRVRLRGPSSPKGDAPWHVDVTLPVDPGRLESVARAGAVFLSGLGTD
jgi:hypothetical protein